MSSIDLSNSVEEFPLSTMLNLVSSNHSLQDLIDSLLRVALLDQILHDGVLGDLRTDDKAATDLSLDTLKLFLILLRREAFDTGECSGHGGRHSRYIEQSKCFIDVGVVGERFHAHFG
jgi:hypothetical protein